MCVCCITVSITVRVRQINEFFSSQSAALGDGVASPPGGEFPYHNVRPRPLPATRRHRQSGGQRGAAADGTATLPHRRARLPASQGALSSGRSSAGRTSVSSFDRGQSPRRVQPAHQPRRPPYSAHPGPPRPAQHLVCKRKFLYDKPSISLSDEYRRPNYRAGEVQFAYRSQVGPDVSFWLSPIPIGRELVPPLAILAPYWSVCRLRLCDSLRLWLESDKQAINRCRSQRQNATWIQ